MRTWRCYDGRTVVAFAVIGNEGPGVAELFPGDADEPGVLCDGWIVGQHLFIPRRARAGLDVALQPVRPIEQRAGAGVDGQLVDGWLRIGLVWLDTRAGWHDVETGRLAVLLPTGPALL